MALGGPRLDRPSAVGDEGRPRTVSLWVASGAVVGLVLAAGFVVGSPGLLGTLGTPVGLVVAGIALVEREQFGHALAGYLLYVLFGGVLLLTPVSLVLLGSVPVGVLFLLFGFEAALGGVGVAWADVSALSGLKRLTVGTAVVYGVTLVTLVLVGVAVVVFLAGDTLLSRTTSGTTPVASTVWFLLVVGYAAGGLRLALWRLPLAQLVSYRHRPAVLARLRTAEVATLVAALLTPALAVLLVVAAALGAVDALLATVPAAAAALDALSAPALLGTLAGVGTVAALAGTAAVLVRLTTRRFDTGSVRWAAAATAGVVLAGLVATGVGMAFTLPALNTIRGAVTLIFAAVVAPPLLIFATVVALVGVATGLVPDRAGGPAVAAAGLVLAAAGIGSRAPALSFACVAGAAVVWDTTWFGLGLTAELGHIPDTRRLELFHAVLVVAVGAVAVGVLSALNLLRRTAFAAEGTTAALFVVGVGVLLLLLPLRG